MSRRSLLVASLWLVLVLLGGAACQPLPTEPPAHPTPTAVPPTPTPTATPVPTPVPQKTLVICQQQEPETLYWYGGGRVAAQNIFQAIYDGPIDSRSYAYQPVILEKLPSLADGDAIIEAVTVQAGDKVLDVDQRPVKLSEGVRVRPSSCYDASCAVEFTGEPLEMDRMVVTFRLRDGVSWSDGQPVTADDSVYGYELSGDPSTPVSKFLYERTSDYAAVDARTTVWTGLPGFMDDEYAANFWMPMPRHLWQDQLGYAPADLLKAEDVTRLPLGWGPFMIKEWVSGDHITLERNPHYFRAAEGLPRVDVVIFRFVSDPNEAVSQLLAGDCDIVTSDVPLGGLAALLTNLEEHGLARMIAAPNTQWEHADFNIQPVEEAHRPNFFADARVRQAVAFCLDRKSVADQMHAAAPSDDFVPPEHPLYAAGALSSYDYDPERGQRLLDEVGWRDEDGDGVREAHDIEGITDGTPFEITWLSALDVRYPNTFQENLAACGIKVKVEHLPNPELFAAGPDGPLFGRSFDIASFAWTLGREPQCDLYLGSEIPTADNQWGGQNISGFADESYDEACRAALQALPGTDAYTAQHQAAQRIFSRQLPALSLFIYPKLAATRSDVVGMTLDPTEPSGLWNIEEIDVQR